MFSLLIPPISDCFMPTLGVAQIAAYLKEKKISCVIHDLSIDFIRYCATLCDTFDKEYVHLLGDGKNISDLSNAKKRLNLISALQTEFRMSTESVFFCFDWRNKEKLVNYVRKKSEPECLLCNLPVLRNIAENSNYIGFSVSYEGQFLLSLIMAKIIKQINSKAIVIFGGSFFYNYFKECAHLISDFNYVDYLIMGPGEVVVENIITNNFQAIDCDKGFRFTKVNNLSCVDSTLQSDVPLVYKPYFNDIKFDRYLSKENAFPYMIKNRCYYGLCNFCNGDKINNQSASKDVVQAFENINSISRDIGVYNVYIVDAAISPVDLRKISKLDFPIDVRWIANARFEKNMADPHLWFDLKKSGCVMIRFGFESGSQRVLDLMRKGTDITVVSDILRMSYNAGIKNHVYVMFGYPGETSEDRQETINFLYNHRNFIYSYSVSVFDPVPNTFAYNELLRRLGRDEYSHRDLLDILYPTEDFFYQIVQDIKYLNKKIGHFCRTNGEWGEKNKNSGEFYSANIFSKESDSCHELIIPGCVTIFPVTNKISRLTLPYKYVLNEKTDHKISQATMIDLESNSIFMLNISWYWIKHLREGFAGSMETFISKTCQPRDKVMELISILTKYTNCVHAPSIEYTCENKYFSVIEYSESF